MKEPGFVVRMLIVFIPLMLFLFLMHLAGITENLFMTILLALIFTWFIQAIYKKVMRKKMEEYEAGRR